MPGVKTIRVGESGDVLFDADVLWFDGATVSSDGRTVTITITGGGGGTTNHTALSNLAWTASAHTGTASRFAVFNGSGAASELALPSVGLVAWTGSAWAATIIDAPLSLAAGHLSITQADASHNGYLTSTDWSVFNGKQAGSAELTALAGLSSTGVIVRTGTATYTVATYTGLSLSTAALSVIYGTTSNTACQGNDSRLSDSRAPTGSAGGDLGGTYPNPTVSQARGLRESGGTTLTMGAVSAGQLLGRSGTTIAGINASATPTASYVVVADAGGKVDSWISTASTTVAGLLKIGASGGAQAWAAILDAITALSANGFIARTGAGTVAARTLTPGTGVTITNGDGVSGNPTISMTGGSNTDRDATYAYTVDWYVQKSSILADNGTLTQTGTTAMVFDSLRHKPALRSTTGAIYTTNLDTMIWGGDFTASAVILTNPTALTGNVYKFGLTTSNTMTTALADAVQQFSIVYRQASGGNWRIITRNATTTTDTDSGVTVVASTWYRFEIVGAAGGTSVDVTIRSGTISTWTSSTTVTVTATLPVSDTFHGLYLYNGTTSGTMALYFYGAHFQQVFRT